MEQVDNNGTLHNSPCAGPQDLNGSVFVVHPRYRIGILTRQMLGARSNRGNITSSPDSSATFYI
ncbi:hypothetical protein F9C07_13102 [Aspergillus flavus]|uniref:Uncharacterized protein n=1 Tax=Aspergillus flavus (strain ATCC 200026 / FGSC A1120 / IAM 13836 / NRRL 3357 / JCM 12722 / SRRC 167) TaxID=332952 RepID=A0A7U2R3E9_ASPFN|nr:hypothetical protein F9C07_13102 [Aspergillus flavus]